MRPDSLSLHIRWGTLTVLPPNRHSGDANMSGCECKRARSVSAKHQTKRRQPEIKWNRNCLKSWRSLSKDVEML